ncbi:MAG: hypothetical protein Tsb0020_47640 [Haliangiales bacterium]
MLELVEFPYLPAGDPKQAVSALIHACRDLPAQGEQFRFFRRRMKSFRLWDDALVAGTLSFLGMERVGTMRPSPLARQIGALKSENKARALITERLWEINPLLFKCILEYLNERVYSRDEVIKYIDSFAYRGTKPSRPQLEAWLHLALGLGVLKMVGIALDLDDVGREYLARASELDIDEYLEDVAAGDSDSDGDSEAGDGDELSGASDGGDGGALSPQQQPGAAAVPGAGVGDGARSGAGGDERTPTQAAGAGAAAPGSAAPRGAIIDVSAATSPRQRERPVEVAHFAGHERFPDEVLAETTRRIEAWWGEQRLTSRGLGGADFGFEAEAWMEDAQELLYRMATAAALTFRLDRAPADITAAFEALDGSGVLRDLYYGTAPDVLPAVIDAQALMLASLLARRFAEVPDLAQTLEKQASAADAFAALDQALGRGLLRIELFWVMGTLAELGTLRFDDLPEYTALPRRTVRDALYRLGFITSPYAHDAASLVPAAGAARRATNAASRPDEVLTAFALTAGCQYDCPHRRRCEYACRERTE